MAVGRYKSGSQLTLIEVEDRPLEMAMKEMAEEFGKSQMQKAMRSGIKKALNTLRNELGRLLQKKIGLETKMAKHIAKRFIFEIRRDDDLAHMWVRGEAYNRITIHPRSKPKAPQIRFSKQYYKYGKGRKTRRRLAGQTRDPFGGSRGFIASGTYQSGPTYWSKRLKSFVELYGAVRRAKEEGRDRGVLSAGHASDAWTQPEFVVLLNKTMERTINQAWFWLDNKKVQGRYDREGRFWSHGQAFIQTARGGFKYDPVSTDAAAIL